MPALATPTPPQTTQALMTDFLKASSSTAGTRSAHGKRGKPRQSLASATSQPLPSPASSQAYSHQPQPVYYPGYDYGPPPPMSEGYVTASSYHHPYMMTPPTTMAYAYPQPPHHSPLAYDYQMTPSQSSDTISSIQPTPVLMQPPLPAVQETPVVKPTRKYTKKAAIWKENGGSGRKTKMSAKASAAAASAEDQAAEVIVPINSASSSGSQSSSSMSDPFSSTLDSSPPPTRRRIPVTSAGPEGRKLDLTAVETGTEAGASQSPQQTLAPRLATIPSIQTDQDGLARFATAQVVQSEVGWLESLPGPKTPERQMPTSPSSEARATKTKRRLEAFSTGVSSSTSPTKKPRSPASSTSSGSALISTRVEQYGRVALGKEAAVRWLGLERADAAVEETQGRDDIQEDAWIQSQSTDGSASSPQLVRPDWPDDLAPWSTGSDEQLSLHKENAERKVLLVQYLETESEEDEEVVAHVFGRAVGPGRGKSVWGLVPSSPTPLSSPLVPRSTIDLTALSTWQGDPADARSALLLARRKNPPRDFGAQAMYIACRCGSLDEAQSMVSCDGCHTWHHMRCIGAVRPEDLGDSWWCISCEENLGRSHGLLTPPPSSREQILVETADPTRIYRSDLQSLALAPSPMFGGDRLRGLGTPTQKFRTPRIPSSAMSMVRRIEMETPGSPSSGRRSRVLSYGEELDYAPSTLAARNVSGASHQPSTPRFEDLLNAQDDHFDVTSTPSRHLDFTPGQHYLFSTPAGSRARVASTTGQPLAFATPSQDFLKDLQHNEATPALSHLASADSSTFPLSPFNFGSGSGSNSLPRLPSLLANQQHSPSPYGHRRRVSSGNKVSFAPASSSVRLSSRLGYNMGLGFEEEDEADGEISGRRYDSMGIGGLEGSSMR